MKRNTTIIILLFGLNSIGQNNVGIGTSSQQARLDVAGNLRVGGRNANSSYLAFDSASGQFTWNNSYLFASPNQYIIQHSASAEGLAYVNQQLEYRYQDGSPRFFTNWLTGDGYIYGNLGLGHSSPLAPIHMAAGLGSRVIFFGEGNSYNYGIDVQPYRLQIHNDGGSPGLPSSIAFGYGSSANFFENMRVISDGSVGVGTASPESALDARYIPGFPTMNLYGTQHISHFNIGPGEYTYIRGGKNNSKIIINDIGRGKLGVGVVPDTYITGVDVGGRMLVRSGGNSVTTAGIWLNTEFDDVKGAFVGMENDNYVGFYGHNGASWAFSMNTQNGALKINGSNGVTGQVLQSNGAAAPSWVSPTKTFFDNTFLVTSNTSINVGTGSGSFFTIPGMTLNINTNRSARVVVRYNVLAQAGSCGSGTGIFIEMNLNVQGSIFESPLPNNHAVSCERQVQVNGIISTRLAPGNHTLTLQARSAGSTTPAFISCACLFNNSMIVQVFYDDL